jgi:hypothetical protein
LKKLAEAEVSDGGVVKVFELSCQAVAAELTI